MAKQKSPTKLSDLIPDDKNFNKGSEFGSSLIEKSFRKFGAGRSILIDKNNRIIAGNKSVENAGAIGMEDVQIVESDGKRIIAVKRIDIDIDSPIGREMALADNASAKANIVFDAELLEAELTDADVEEWGLVTHDLIEEDVDLKQHTDSAEKYMNNTVRQILLVFDNETHKVVVEKLKAIGEKYNILEDNSATVLKLIEYYEGN